MTTAIFFASALALLLAASLFAVWRLGIEMEKNKRAEEEAITDAEKQAILRRQAAATVDPDWRPMPRTGGVSDKDAEHWRH